MVGWREKLALTAQRNRREIVRANLSRREMMRMGLLTAGGSLVIKQGLSARWAWADQGDGSNLTLTEVQGVDGPPSPPVTPFIQEMPRLPVLQGFTNPNQFRQGRRAGRDHGDRRCHQGSHVTTALHDVPATKVLRIAHAAGQRAAASRLSAEFHHRLGLQRPGSRTADPCQIRRVDPGALLQRPARRWRIPAPDGFGIAEIATHLHNAHTPFESDGNPVDFINSINDPTKLDPLGFKDNHYRQRLCRLHVLRADRRSLGPGNPNEALGSSGTTTTTSISPPRTSTRACSAATTCSTRRYHRRQRHVLRLPSRAISMFRSSSTISCSARTTSWSSTCSTWTAFSAIGSAANGAIQPKFAVAAATLPSATVQSRSVALVSVRPDRSDRADADPVLADLDRRESVAERGEGGHRTALGGRSGSISSSTSTARYSAR